MTLIEQLFNPHQPAKGAWDMNNMRPAVDTVMVNRQLLGEVIIARSRYKKKELKKMRKIQLQNHRVIKDTDKPKVTPNRIIES